MNYAKFELIERANVRPPVETERRRHLMPGDLARLHVLVDVTDDIHPWVEIVEATPTGYLAVVSSAMGTEAWLPYGTRIAFGFAHVVECS